MRKPTIVGLLLSIVIIGTLYFSIGLEGIAKYSPIMILISIILILAAILFQGFLYKKIAWLREPENSEDILNLKMNQSLSFTLALLGFGLAFILTGILPSFSFDIIKILNLVGGLTFIFIGQVIFANEYLPRYQKLLIIYHNKKYIK